MCIKNYSHTYFIHVKYKISLFLRNFLPTQDTEEYWKILWTFTTVYTIPFRFFFHLISFSFFLEAPTIDKIVSNRCSKESSGKGLTPFGPFLTFFNEKLNGIVNHRIYWAYLVNSLNYCAAPHHKDSRFLLSRWYTVSLWAYRGAYSRRLRNIAVKKHNKIQARFRSRSIGFAKFGVYDLWRTIKMWSKN